MFEGLFYAGCRLDRSSSLRRDQQWIAARSAERASRVVPVWRERVFLPPYAAHTPITLQGEEAAASLAAADAVIFLGVDTGGAAWFAADLSSLEQDRLIPPLQTAKASDLRRISRRMAPDEAAVLAYARGMALWHQRHRFCNVCGSPAESRDGGHLRICINPDCRTQHFPRTDPAVIMLVTRPGPDGGACLLGRQARWPRGMVSTLAGFVEPGETLEEAVAREVREEAGIDVSAIRYRGSQPWPFPSSLMLGFRAVAPADAVIRLDEEELAFARWFTRSDIARFPENGLKLPRGDSIARRLVEEWLAEAPE